MQWEHAQFHFFLNSFHTTFIFVRFPLKKIRNKGAGLSYEVQDPFIVKITEDVWIFISIFLRNPTN